MNPQIFAAVCAVESVAQLPQVSASWTTGSGTGSDPDDLQFRPKGGQPNGYPPFQNLFDVI